MSTNDTLGSLTTPTNAEAITIAASEIPQFGGSDTLPDVNDSFVPISPKSLEDASLDESDVTNLILKFLYIRGSFTGHEIADQIKLPYPIVEEQLNSLRNQTLIGYRGSSVGGDYQYELTPRGVEQARDRASICTYFGAAPVSVNDYLKSIKRQTLKNLKPKYQQVAHAMDDLVLAKSVVSQVGQAINSGRSLFLFGSPGNGKTSIATRILRAVSDAIWIPRTLTVGGEVVRLYDPSLHEELPLPDDSSITKANTNIDHRWIRIRRPTIFVGGELTLSHLETTLNPVTGIIESPVHLKSNCGCLVVDDFGRQRMSIIELLNRWIVPLERGYDYVNLPSGRQLKIPFDQLVVFSTNLRPSDLCDEAFLRRIPYKVQVLDPTEQQFRELFAKRTKQYNLECDPVWIDYLIENHYRKCNRTMRFSHIDDLLRQVSEFCEFHDQPMILNRETLEIAVNNYFAAMDATTH